MALVHFQQLEAPGVGCAHFGNNVNAEYEDWLLAASAIAPLLPTVQRKINKIRIDASDVPM